MECSNFFNHAINSSNDCICVHSFRLIIIFVEFLHVYIRNDAIQSIRKSELTRILTEHQREKSNTYA